MLLDGAATTRSENGSSFDETAPSVEALGEFKVLTSTVPAEFGRTTGGVETFSTKSGSNTYHGNVYEIFRNEDLNANVWGNNYVLGGTQGLSETSAGFISVRWIDRTITVSPWAPGPHSSLVRREE